MRMSASRGCTGLRAGNGHVKKYRRAADDLTAVHVDETHFTSTSDSSPHGVPQVEHKKFAFANPYGLDRAIVFTQILDGYGCRAARQPDPDRNRQMLHAMGFRSDLELAEKLFDSVEPKITEVAEHGEPPKMRINRGQFRKSYISGIGFELSLRVQEARSATVPGPVMKVRVAQVNRAFLAQFPGTLKVARPVYSRDGFSAGRDWAGNIPLPGIEAIFD